MAHEIRSPHDRSNPRDIQQMFNAIAPTYDKLNHLLSFGLDIKWRQRAIREFNYGGTYLDIAAGSGDVSFDMMELHPTRIVSVDFAVEMLAVFKDKLEQKKGIGVIDLLSCDALALPFVEETFDGTIVAFGMRNFADRLQSLKEMLRVLKPGGTSVVLELTKPRKPFVSQAYSLYANVGLPLLGKIISRHNSAYRYLPDSIAQFPAPAEFCSLMDQAGFTEVRAVPLTFGTATVFVGKKLAARK
ncbi:MAG TPA: bifunctional demethylmenaquinone methyltransferase/2-methoxy-6-polyprenyl-1,4-benzoquinol methylase UbiE [Bacteroidota bacterium]|jgi:demethylmenaquinone methyltransferase/2-methoxy-6-polyprenyl-1,4-benzoquinol methylase|nr:bifunctional demethylmenaquinone methyltransferase/2-methoxy-6-polyprenyl-1,4-benzoquinol methylase UbiE [Bacteroidota bacterium]